ncbi:hypothetical protein [Pseudonocardia parietis]|uniref:Uncharacterized protein n=1 Tax=Pseudonocardia parietis TaxID=570936 RepID=A0ABS4VQT0_9PSEU|nr:hypothetical protein [Pseudonocardia parietis]MBP2366271.1 hypothetical protein [Pseudonocardia parietis]
MRETVTDEETLTLTITGRTGSWLVSGVLGGQDLPLQGMDDRGLREMLQAMLPARAATATATATAAGAHRRPESPATAPGVQRRGGRHRRAG